MYRQSLFVLVLLGLPALAFAAQSLDSILVNLALFIDSTLIPFLFGIAFLFFVVNVIRFFVLGSSKEEGRENARNLITYSVLAFVFLIIFWGVINLLTSSLGFTKLASTGIPCSDYMIRKGVNCDNNPSGTTGDGESLGTSNFGGNTSSDTGASLPGPTTPVTGSGHGTPSLPAPVVNNDAYPVVNSDNIAAAADAEQTKETVQAIATDFINKIPNIYDWRISRVVEDAVTALKDPTASNEERVIAAIRLKNNNQMTNSDLNKYVGVLNVEQRVDKLPELDMTDLRREAEQTTELMDEHTNFTKRSLLPVIAKAHEGWFVFGKNKTEAQAAAQQDLDYIYRDGALGKERIEAFDNIISKGSFPSDDTMPNLRIRLINDTNGELFFAGQPPLKLPGQALNTPGPNN